MKISIVVMLCSMGSIMAAPLFSQQAKLDVSYRQQPLGQVLNDLRDRSGFDLIFFDGVVPENTPVTIVKRNVTIGDILDEILPATGLGYTINENIVTIKRAEASQQQGPARRIVAGRVTDTSGAPLAGVSVMIKGTEQGTVTAADGRYSMNVARGATLVFSYIGMTTQEIRVGSQESISVSLAEVSADAGEVVVTGVFDRPREAFTGAANLITREDLKSSSSQGLLSSIANIDPSFKYIQSNTFGSDPNKLNQANITMRGGTALMDYQNDYENAVSANRPIFVIDGFVSTIEQFLALDESRVESVTTLKDAAATALYGTQAANGVVVITTVQPKEGKIQVIYKGTFALEVPDLSSYNLMNGNEKLQFELESGLYTSQNIVDDYLLKGLYHSRKMDVARGIDTDWLGFPLRTAFSHNHALTLSGGEGAIRYALDVGNNRKLNVMKGSFNNTFNGSMYLNYKVKNVVFSNRITVTTTYGPNSPYGNFSDYTKLNAYWQPYDENGNPIKVMDQRSYANLDMVGKQAEVIKYSRNPLYNASLVSRNESRNTTIQNNLQAEWNITPHLKAIGQFSVRGTNKRTDVFKSPLHTDFDDYSVADAARKGTYTYTPRQDMSYDGSLKVQYSRYINDKHYLLFGATGRFYQYTMENYIIEAEGITVPYMDYFVAATKYKKDGVPGGGEGVLRTMSTSFLANYMYDGRYYVELNGSLDGSSEYGSSKQSAPTGTIGVGWNINKEDFMQNQGVISRAKLRASYGLQGSAGSYNAYDALRLYDMMGSSYRGNPGMNMASLGNPDLKWQSTKQLNVGTDLGFMKDRFSVIFDVYNKVTTDLLTTINIATASGVSSYKANVGKVRNRGWEFQFTGKVIENRARKFDWTVMFNANHNKNTVLDIGDYLEKFNQNMISEANKTNDQIQTIRRNPAFMFREGESMHTNFVVMSKGIDPATGREIFVKLDGTETFDWNSDDRQAFGTTDPTLWGTFGTSVRWKGFTLATWFTYTTGAHKYNKALLTKVENIYPYHNADKRALYDRWRNPGDVVSFKGLKEYTNNTNATSRFIAKERVLRNTSLSLRYTVPAEWAKRNLGAQFVEIQAQTEDLFYLTTLEDERGINNPFSRNFSMTLRLTF